MRKNLKAIKKIAVFYGMVFDKNSRKNAKDLTSLKCMEVVYCEGVHGLSVSISYHPLQKGDTVSASNRQKAFIQPGFNIVSLISVPWFS